MQLKDEVIVRWTARLEEWRRLSCQVDGVAIAEEILADLRAIASASGDSALTLPAAAELSGYSVDHLARLLRAGTIPNAGRKGAPRILRRDLPVRPGRIAGDAHQPYNAATDALSLVGSRR